MTRGTLNVAREEGSNVTTKRFEDLLVWQSAMELATLVYRVTIMFPNEEKFGLMSQLRRAAVSVPSNIAEGQGRRTRGEFLQFLGNARGSLYEIRTQILIAREMGYKTETDFEEVRDLDTRVGQLLGALIRSLEKP